MAEIGEPQRIVFPTRRDYEDEELIPVEIPEEEPIPLPVEWPLPQEVPTEQ